MKYKGELQKIDTEEKAYLLGFIYGDGCITTYLEKTGRERFLTKVSIQERDKQLIKTFKYIFPFFNIKKFDYSKYNKKSQVQYSISKSSKELFKDLEKNGVYTRKSFENKELLKIPNISKELLPSFIRGLWDSDGSFYTTKQRPNLLLAEFCSSSQNLVEEVNYLLEEEGIKTLGVRERDNNNKSLMYSITIVETLQVQSLVNLLYKDSSIFLERKYNKAINHVYVDKVKDRDIKCPRCSSIETHKNGKRYGNIRMKCKQCNKNFTIKN